MPLYHHVSVLVLLSVLLPLATPLTYKVHPLEDSLACENVSLEDDLDIRHRLLHPDASQEDFVLALQKWRNTSDVWLLKDFAAMFENNSEIGLRPRDAGDQLAELFVAYMDMRDIALPDDLMVVVSVGDACNDTRHAHRPRLSLSRLITAIVADDEWQEDFHGEWLLHLMQRDAQPYIRKKRRAGGSMGGRGGFKQTSGIKNFRGSGVAGQAGDISSQMKRGDNKLKNVRNKLKSKIDSDIKNKVKGSIHYLSCHRHRERSFNDEAGYLPSEDSVSPCTTPIKMIDGFLYMFDMFKRKWERIKKYFSGGPLEVIQGIIFIVRELITLIPLAITSLNPLQWLSSTPTCVMRVDHHDKKVSRHCIPQVLCQIYALEINRFCNVYNSEVICCCYGWDGCNKYAAWSTEREAQMEPGAGDAIKYRSALPDQKSCTRQKRSTTVAQLTTGMNELGAQAMRGRREKRLTSAFEAMATEVVDDLMVNHNNDTLRTVRVTAEFNVALTKAGNDSKKLERINKLMMIYWHRVSVQNKAPQSKEGVITLVIAIIVLLMH